MGISPDTLAKLDQELAELTPAEPALNDILARFADGAGMALEAVDEELGALEAMVGNLEAVQVEARERTAGAFVPSEHEGRAGSAPSESAPSEPAPFESAPSEPAPFESAPSEPAPVSAPSPTSSSPSESAPASERPSESAAPSERPSASAPASAPPTQPPSSPPSDAGDGGALSEDDLFADVEEDRPPSDIASLLEGADAGGDGGSELGPEEIDLSESLEAALEPEVAEAGPSPAPSDKTDEPTEGADSTGVFTQDDLRRIEQDAHADSEQLDAALAGDATNAQEGDQGADFEMLAEDDLVILDEGEPFPKDEEEEEKTVANVQAYDLTAPTDGEPPEEDEQAPEKRGFFKKLFGSD